MKPTGKVFMAMTRYEELSPSDQSMGLPAPLLEKPVPPGVVPITLPQIDQIVLPNLFIRNGIRDRRSIRRYDKSPITREELAYLLWATQGIHAVQDPYYTLRSAPSAGGRHAFETYLCINRVEGIAPGIYRYIPFTHTLIPIDLTPGTSDRTMEACLGQAFTRSSAVVFLWSCIIYRMAWRYSERAYRLVHLDAGHVCQNLYLAGEEIGCGVCAIAAFDDQLAADLLLIDGEEEFVIYCATVGKKEIR